MTPKTVNSLAAIAGHEGDEEPWNTPYDAEEVSTLFFLHASHHCQTTN